jgi:hypothetical protein
MDGRNQTYLTWYTEGAQGRPAVLFASSSDGRRFTDPQRLDTSAGSIPDHVRMAVDTEGRLAVVWEDSTAVRRRVLLRYSSDGGRTFSPIQSLSPALKAYAPDIAASPLGGVVVVWHEEEFPVLKTVVRALQFNQD